MGLRLGQMRPMRHMGPMGLGHGILGQRSDRAGRFCPASERDGFRYGHPGCSYSSCVAAKAAKQDRIPARPVGQTCPASEQDGFRYGHPGCSYSSCFAAKAAKQDRIPARRVGRFCPASERDGFKYGHPGCSYSSCVAALAAKHGAFPVGLGQTGRTKLYKVRGGDFLQKS